MKGDPEERAAADGILWKAVLPCARRLPYSA